MCRWDPQAKLVNLVTRLRGQAYSFYRSCTSLQHASYDALVAELSKRFTPVRIQAIESSLFHKRKQKPNETVDAYAQELRMLFNRAYPLAQQGTHEAETMGQSILAYQFVSGLRSKIKAKVAGCDGDFEQLLVKARFEEAKLCDLEEPVSRGGPRTSSVMPAQGLGLPPIRNSVGVQAGNLLMDQPVVRVDLSMNIITVGPGLTLPDNVHIAGPVRLRGRVGETAALLSLK